MDSGQDHSLSPAVGSTETNHAAELSPETASALYPLDQSVATVFEALPDGSLLELVTAHEGALGLKLLHWSNSGCVITDRLHFGGKIFAPPQLSSSLVRAVRMPTAVTPSGAPRLMFNRISKLLRTFIDLPDEMLVRVVAHVLATWFPEQLTVAPLLWITGPPTSGKTTLLRLLHCLCRRPILVTDVTPAALYSLPALLRPTMLIDECELGNSGADQHVIRLIRAGSTRGVHVARKGEVFDLFCPKAVASRTWPDDAAVASRAVFVAMPPTRRILPAFDPQLIADEVDALQAQLLDFRLRNFHLVRGPQLRAASELNPRTLQIARSLAAPFLSDELLEAQLISSLRQQDQEADAVRHGQPEWVIVEALFRLAHEKPAGELFVQQIAFRANDILSERGDNRSFKARRVGSILRSLGIYTERLGSWGRGIRICPQHQRQVHRLAYTFGITRRDTTGWMALKGGYGGPPCQLCGEFDLNAGLRFVPQPQFKPRPRLFERADPPDEAVESSPGK